MKRYLLALLFIALMLVATAAPAFASHCQGGCIGGSRPIIGGAPPGEGQQNPNASSNPSTDDRAEPRTGGQAFDCHGLQGRFCY